MAEALAEAEEVLGSLVESQKSKVEKYKFMKILSWNVNGIRAAMKKGFTEFLKREKPDFLMLQETKIAFKDIQKQEFDFFGYEEFWYPALRPGYSGTAILIRSDKKFLQRIISKSNGFDIPEYDQEGRTQIIELDKFFLVNSYFPNSSRDLSRLPFKIIYNKDILKFLKKLEKKKPVIIGGDFNAAHQEIDLARPKPNIGNAGFTDDERGWINDLIKAGFIDTYRFLNPDKIEYSWWGYKFNSREKNIGWRVDYLFTSKALKNKIKNAFIMTNIVGSDHCPVGIEIYI